MVIEPGNSSISNRSTSSGRAQQADAGKVASGTEKAPSQPSSSDSVSLSSASLAISKIESKLGESSEVDTAKIAEIKASIDSGSYTVDSQAIADKISQEEGFLG